jgi:hypothetical protein
MCCDPHTKCDLCFLGFLGSLQCLHYGTRNLTKIWCKFDMVIFTVRPILMVHTKNENKTGFVFVVSKLLCTALRQHKNFASCQMFVSVVLYA